MSDLVLPPNDIQSPSGFCFRPSDLAWSLPSEASGGVDDSDVVERRGRAT